MDQPNSEQSQPSVVKRARNAAVVNTAASAGVIVGIFGGLMVVGAISDKLSKRKTKTEDSETV